MALGGLSEAVAGRGPPRAVLLDAMGTLVRLRDPAPALVAALQRDHGVRVGEAQARVAFAAEIAYYRAHHLQGADAVSLADLRLRCAEVLRDGLRPAAQTLSPRAIVPALVDALRFGRFSDVVPALRALRGSGLRLVAVSNWDVSLPDVLVETGVAAHLDDVVASAAVGAAKPDPAIFTAALRAAGVDPEQALRGTVDRFRAGAEAREQATS